MKHTLKVLFGAVHEFEIDPVEQYRFHLFMTWAWLIVMVVIPRMGAFKGQPAALLIMEVSLWANFVSHFTAVGASLSGVIGSHREAELHKSIIRRFIWRKKIQAAKFANPNYRPPSRGFLDEPDKVFSFDSETDPLGRDDTDDVSSEPYAGEAHF